MKVIVLAMMMSVSGGWPTLFGGSEDSEVTGTISEEADWEKCRLQVRPLKGRTWASLSESEEPKGGKGWMWRNYRKQKSTKKDGVSFDNFPREEDILDMIKKFSKNHEWKDDELHKRYWSLAKLPEGERDVVDWAEHYEFRIFCDLCYGNPDGCFDKGNGKPRKHKNEKGEEVNMIYNTHQCRDAECGKQRKKCPVCLRKTQKGLIRDSVKFCSEITSPACDREMYKMAEDYRWTKNSSPEDKKRYEAADKAYPSRKNKDDEVICPDCQTEVGKMWGYCDTFRRNDCGEFKDEWQEKHGFRWEGSDIYPSNADNCLRKEWPQSDQEQVPPAEEVIDDTSGEHRRLAASHLAQRLADAEASFD